MLSMQPMQSSFIPLFVATLLLVATGCQSTGRAGHANLPTHGIAMTMLVSDEKTAHTRYELKRDGSVSFAGGFDAMQKKPSWSDALTLDESQRLFDTLAQHGWLDGEPEVTGESGSLRVKVKFSSRDARYDFDTHGGGGAVDAVRELLAEITNRRHAEYLDRLPEASKVDPNDL